MIFYFWSTNSNAGSIRKRTYDFKNTEDLLHQFNQDSEEVVADEGVMTKTPLPLRTVLIIQGISKSIYPIY